MAGTFIDNVAGLVTNPGTSDFTGLSAWGQAEPMSTLTTGNLYAYKAIYLAGTPNAYETGTGVWNGSTLARTTIKTSSNGGSKVNFTGGQVLVVIVADTAMLQRSGWDMNQTRQDRDAQDPDLNAMTGQSNAGDIYTSRKTLTYNPNVWVWMTDGVPLAGTGTWHEPDPIGAPGVYEWLVPPEQDPARFAWRQYDPNATSFVSSPGDAVIYDYGVPDGVTRTEQPMYCGLTRNGGSIAWGHANAKQILTGRDQYVFCLFHAGKQIALWADGGTMRTEYDTQMTAALAALTALYPNVTHIDEQLWMQGETDATIETPPVEYSESWAAFHDWTIAQGFADANKTRRIIFDINRRNTNALWKYNTFEGLRYAQQADEGRTILLSSANKEYIEGYPDATQGVHLWGDMAVMFGEEGARASVFGPPTMLDHVSPFVANDAYEIIFGGIYENEGNIGAPPSRPSASTPSSGYWGTDLFDGITFTDKFSIFLDAPPWEDIQAGDTITITDSADATKWTRYTVDVAGVYDSTPAGAFDTGYWYFETTPAATGPGGAPAVGAVCTIETSRQHLLPVTDLLNSNTGGRIGIGYEKGDLLPDAQLAVKLADGVEFAFSFEDIDGNTFKSIINRSSGAATFSASGILGMQSAGGIVFYQVVDPGTGQLDTGIHLRARTDRDPVLLVGGREETFDIPTDAQLVVGPHTTRTSTDDQGIALAGTAGSSGWYGFVDPADTDAWIGKWRYTHSDDRLSAVNFSPTSSNEMGMMIDADFIGLYKDDTAADSSTWGIYFTLTKGSGVQMTAGVASAPTTAAQPMTMRFTSLTLPHLAGTGRRTLTASTAGLVQAISTTEHSYETLNVPAGAAYTFTATTFAIADGETIAIRADASAKRTDGTAGSMAATFTATITRVGATHTTSGATMIVSGKASTGTGSTLDMRVAAAGGVILPSCKQQTGETWTWDIDWRENNI